MSKSPKAVIIDYEAGNLGSVLQAMRDSEWDVSITTSAKDIIDADLAVIPGVGHFGQCAKALRDSGLAGAILERINDQKPLFGICIGMQILYSSSEEAPGAKGLNFVKGTVHKIPDEGVRTVPHMGWNELSANTDSKVVAGLDGEYVYFVHSYMVVPGDEHTFAYTDHDGIKIPAIIQQGPILATQFHPEKSGLIGKRFLANLKELSWV